MPNDCWNTLTFISENNPNELARLYDTEIHCSNIPDEWVKIQNKHDNAINLTLRSNWEPDLEWLVSMLTKYPNCWIKNDWYEEGGTSGIFVGGFLNGKQQKTIIQQWEELPIEGKVLYKNR